MGKPRKSKLTATVTKRNVPRRTARSMRRMATSWFLFFFFWNDMMGESIVYNTQASILGS